MFYNENYTKNAIETFSVFYEILVFLFEMKEVYINKSARKALANMLQE